MIPFKNKKAVVLGAMMPGQAAVRLLHKQGCKVTLVGVAATELDRQRMREYLKGVPFEYHNDEEIDRDYLKSFDLVVLTPGGGRTFTAQVEEARKAGATVLSELDLALMFLRAPLIAVTGTNGKTTAVHVIKSIFEKSGKKVLTAGGEYEEYCEVAINPDKCDYYIFEINSSCLIRARSIAPQIAVLLNIHSGHSERHPTFKEYAEAKAKIFIDQKPEQFLVFPAQMKTVVELIQEKNPKSQRFPFSFSGPLAKGIYTDIPQKKYVFVNPKSGTSTFDYSRLGLVGIHNIETAMVGVCVAKLCGLQDALVQQALQELKAPRDRMEPLQKIAGVQYINDARASNAVATYAALYGFPDRSVILIAGGQLAPFLSDSGLLEMIKQKVHTLVIFGSARREFHRVWEGLTDSYVVPDLKDAVELASKKAEKGFTVLFSPASRPEFHSHGSTQRRGDEFRRCVEEVSEMNRARQVVQRRI